MTRLDVPAPAGVCGYAFAAPDTSGVIAWWRCGRDYGHAGQHATIPAPGLSAYVGSHTTFQHDTPTDDNTPGQAGRGGIVVVIAKQPKR